MRSLIRKQLIIQQSAIFINRSLVFNDRYKHASSISKMFPHFGNLS